MGSSLSTKPVGAHKHHTLINTCPKAVEKESCHAGRVVKKKLTVRAEKIKIADELEICRKMVVSKYLSISVPAASPPMLRWKPAPNSSERKRWPYCSRTIV
eukprot:Skav226209  [mRNA]  locus=scaffold2208:558137:567125:+ [translate_table: standard]